MVNRPSSTKLFLECRFNSGVDFGYIGVPRSYVGVVESYIGILVNQIGDVLGPSKPAPVRAHPSQSAQQAGAAALNRLTKDSSTENSMQKNRQMKSIKEQARRELEAEQAVDKEVEKLKEVYGDREIPECLGPSQLEGVYYKCPLIGEEMYTKDVMKGKIKEFLYSQLESERALTAALIIHTCNSNKEKVSKAW